MTWCIFASDQSDVMLFHKVKRVVPVLLTSTANGSKLRKALTMKTKINFTYQTIQLVTLCQQ